MIIIPGPQIILNQAAVAATYLLNETFEGTGYDNGQSITFTPTGTVDEDFSTSGLNLEGSQCLKLDGTSADSYIISSTFPSTYSPAWATFQFRAASLPNSAGRTIFTFRNSTTTLLQIWFNNTGTLSAKQGSGTTATTSGTLSINTTYYIKVKYVAGSGNGVATVAFSSNTIFPTSGPNYAECIDGTSTLGMNNISLWSDNSATNGVILYFDSLLVDDAEIYL